MTTDKDFSTIATNVYRVDPLAQNPPLSNGEGFPRENPKFVIVGDPESDPVTGFQAMAVAALKGGEPDYSHVYVAFAGTNPGDRADINSDVQVVVGGQTAAATQAAQAKAYAEKMRAAFPHAELSTVGHSLGGYLAIYVAGELRWSATSFNGPDPWDALSPEAQRWIKAQSAKGKNPICNYLNEWDPIGNFLGNGTGGAHYLTGKPGGDAFGYHNMETGFDFNPDGSIKGAGASGRDLNEITRNLLTSVPPFYREPLAGLLAGAMGFLRAPGVGAHAARGISAALVMIDTLGATSLAATVLSASSTLSGIKDVNNSLAPEMREGLDAAKRTVSAIPFVTVADIEDCIIVQRLRVEDNIDEHALADVNRRIEGQQEIIQKLNTGILNAVDNSLRQEARWASVFAGR